MSILDTTVSLALNDYAYAHSHSNLDAISEDALSVKLIDSLIAPRVKFNHTDEVCLSDREDVSRLRIRGDLGIIYARHNVLCDRSENADERAAREGGNGLT